MGHFGSHFRPTHRANWTIARLDPRVPMPDIITYVAGLSLGQANEFTALAVLECQRPAHKPPALPDATYALRHLERFPPGTPYSEIGLATARAVSATKATLVLDQTAVGKAVTDQIRKAGSKHPIGLTVTAGHAVQSDERGGWLVPKKDLVGVLQVLLQGRRLKVADSLEHAKTLVTELQQFRLKAVPMSEDAAIEWRERPDDDLVLAVAVAAWQAERPPQWFVFMVG